MKNGTPELVKRFIEGDNTAFSLIIERFEKRIYYHAFRMLGNHLDADEVVQETFVRIYKKREDLVNVTNFASFLMRVATNYSIDLLRKQKGKSRVTEDSIDLPDNVQLELASRVQTPQDKYYNKVLMLEIRKALDSLPPKQKITALLHDVEGYTKTEIAEILECPEATVRSNLHIARQKLRKLLRKRLPTKE